VIVGYDSPTGTIRLTIKTVGCYEKLLRVLSSPDAAELLPLTFKISRGGTFGDNAFVACEVKTAKEIVAGEQ